MSKTRQKLFQRFKIWRLEILITQDTSLLLHPFPTSFEGQTVVDLPLTCHTNGLRPVTGIVYVYLYLWILIELFQQLAMIQGRDVHQIFSFVCSFPIFCGAKIPSAENLWMSWWRSQRRLSRGS